MTDILRLKDVSKQYRIKGELPVKAVNQITLNVKKGEFLAVCGVSGSGKSTLLHLISGVLRPDSGSIEVLRDDEYFNILNFSSKELADYRNECIGYVLQDFGLISYRNVKENVAVPLYINGTKGSTINSRIDEVLERVGLPELKNRAVTKLSGGQKQRIAIARAIINNPSIILADEPTGALDYQTKGEIMTLFKELAKEGKTIIMVTHDKEAAEECDRIINIRDGKLID